MRRGWISLVAVLGGCTEIDGPTEFPDPVFGAMTVMVNGALWRSALHPDLLIAQHFPGSGFTQIWAVGTGRGVQITLRVPPLPRSYPIGSAGSLVEAMWVEDVPGDRPRRLHGFRSYLSDGSPGDELVVDEFDLVNLRASGRFWFWARRREELPAIRVAGKFSGAILVSPPP